MAIHIPAITPHARNIHPAPKQTVVNQETAASPAAKSPFSALFPDTGTHTPAPAQSTAPPAPTAESVFGANPWLANPTGQGPGGSFGFNPIYFATPQTAAQVATMLGGKVVQANDICSASGSPFAQQQPNEMVQLPNGKVVNAGVIASFYTHGYPQSFVDQMVANEIKSDV